MARTKAPLAGVVSLVAKDPKFKGLIANLGENHLHVTGSMQTRPWILAVTARKVPLLVVTATGREAEDLHGELASLLGAEAVAWFPSWETLPHERLSPSPEVVGERARILAGVESGTIRVVIAAARAYCQPINHSGARIELREGGEYDLQQLAHDLGELAYKHVDMVAKKGEFAIRGGLIDIFPTTADYPVRVEFWGDEITDMRAFSVADQRALSEEHTYKHVPIFPARALLIDESVAAAAAELLPKHTTNQTLAEILSRVSDGIYTDGMEALAPVLSTEPYRALPEFFPENTHTILVDPEKIRTRVEDLINTDQEFLEAGWEAAAMGASGPVAAADVDLSASSYRSFESLKVNAQKIAGGAVWNLTPSGMMELDESALLPIDCEAAPAPKGDPALVATMMEKLKLHVESGGIGVYIAPAQGAVKRMKDRFLEAHIAAEIMEPGATPIGGQMNIYLGLSHGGLVFTGPQMVVITETDVTGNRVVDLTGEKRRPAKRRHRVDPLALKPGDLVVHETHGIGRFKEMVERTITIGDEQTRREYLVLEYAPSRRGGAPDQLFVPMDSLDMLSRYVGGENPSLSKMGGSDWKNTKKKARAAVREIAGELVELYAKRQSTPGHAFAPDSPWQAEMEDHFPYVETEDQMSAIEAVKEDMEKTVPMDRVIVGDVGYGKTEVAVRAAFKAVQDGRQVAVLVPTTLLAQQHLSTFATRMEGFPVTIRALSRFTTNAEAKEVLKGLANGEVDIVIGTHRLLQTGVSWKNLGLVIIDEEQRFGVEHKEHIKALRVAVDVLTMSATPIPRTLEMSMAGIREMSTILTPPQARHPVLTYVGAQEEKQIAASIRRELLRDGQVFYVHNKVKSIEKRARELRELVPEARIVVAHGQMSEEQLERTVQGFWDREYDVLVCTTIVETGLDIANANTLIVENAHHMGLSQLHQLRGRVGRSRERGYAYFLYPKGETLTETSYDRLSTIAQNNDLGAGMAVAMKDLEMRGAGNVLGAQQSGHIAGVGFDLYVRLVGEAVEAFRAMADGKVIDATDQSPKEIRIDLPVDAHIPEAYINAERLRLEVYRKLAAATTEGAIRLVVEEMEDRYGPIPEEVERLLSIARLRLAARAAGITDIGMQGTRIKVHPVELLDSQQVRLKRLFPGATYRAAAKAIQLSVPKAGKKLTDPPMRDVDLVQWMADFLHEMFDAPQIDVRAGKKSTKAAASPKKKVISIQ
ncbi:MAG: transcription-repair coupling factor [Corynebacterium sp.]|nr:transcription-repair coupling factor [Corynebacterium sp.]